ncbi:MAG: DMT family transporter [Candidatus Binatia bacterium]
MLRGVLAAFAATILYNLSVVIQKMKAQQASTSGFRLIATLVTKPLWLFGVGLQTAGLAFHFFALTKAPVTVVQPVIAAGVVFVVIFAALLLGERPGRQELTGMVTAMGGVTVLLATVGEPVGMQRVRAAELSAAVVALAVLIAVLLAATAWRRLATASAAAACIGVAAGLAQGMSDAMNRLMGAWLSPGAGWVPTPGIGRAAVACLLAFGIVGLVVTQNALRLYRANTVVPCMLTAQLLVPVSMAIALYGQALPSGTVSEVAWLAACILVVVGVVVLSTSAQVASKFAPPA